MNNFNFTSLIDPNIQEAILYNIKMLQNEVKRAYPHEKRDLLNKWFQDTVKNYFMEEFAAPILKKQIGMKYNKEVRTFISQKLNKTIPKYMSIVESYYFFLLEHRKIQEFCDILLCIVNDPIEKISNKDDLKLLNEKKLKKQYVSLLLLKFFDKRGSIFIPSFERLWNLSFPDEQLTVKKNNRSKKYQREDIEYDEDSLKQKEFQINNTVDNYLPEEIISDINDNINSECDLKNQLIDDEANPTFEQIPCEKFTINLLEDENNVNFFDLMEPGYFESKYADEQSCSITPQNFQNSYLQKYYQLEQNQYCYFE